MSIALDNHSASSFSGNTTWTPSYTVGGGSSMYLFAGIISDRAPATVPTYNSVSMSLLASVTLSALVAIEFRVYGLASPTAGANSFGVDMSGGAPTNVVGLFASFSGVGSIGTPATNSIDAQTQAFSTAPLSVAAGQFAYAASATYNRTISTSVLTLFDTANPFAAQCGAHAYKSISGAGTEDCRFDWSGNQIWGEISVALLSPDGPPSKIVPQNILRPRPFKPGLAR